MKRVRESRQSPTLMYVLAENRMDIRMQVMIVILWSLGGAIAR